MEKQNQTEKITVKRIGGHLHKVIPIVDQTGKILHHVIQPFQVELKFHDLFQIIVGASILVVPVAFTEEVWNLSQELPLKNLLILASISIFNIAAFVYFGFYQHHLKEHIGEYLKRVLATYGLTLLVVAIFLSIIHRCPWGVDNLLAIKRIILVAFPASMSAALSDAMK